MKPAANAGGCDLSPALQLLFIDTEGFESTGKADVYDDRIFALSALISQVHSWATWSIVGLGWSAGQWAARY